MLMIILQVEESVIANANLFFEEPEIESVYFIQDEPNVENVRLNFC